MVLNLNNFKSDVVDELVSFLAENSEGGLYVRRFPIEAQDLKSWLSAQAIYPRVYWQSSSGEFEVAGVGNAFAAMERRGSGMANLLLQAERIIASGSVGERALFFYSAAFDPHHWDLQEWRGFAPNNLIHPQVAIIRERYKTELMVALVMHRGDDPQESFERIERLLSLIQPARETPKLNSVGVTSRRDSPDASHWARTVALAIARITHGDLEKVVLARSSELALRDSVSSLALLDALLAQSTGLYGFILEPKPELSFLGASPECFLRVQGDEIESESLGGSYFAAGANGHAAMRLLASNKDRTEHDVVTQFLRQRFDSFATGIEVEAGPSVRKFANLSHLSTRIRGHRRAGASVAEIASALHPTPAVGGTPTDLARDVIRRLEPFSRGLYAGPIGIIRKGQTELAVALRSLKLSGKVATLYAGAGIVAGSRAQNEWDELEAKIRIPLESFGPSSGSTELTGTELKGAELKGAESKSAELKSTGRAAVRQQS